MLMMKESPGGDSSDVGGIPIKREASRQFCYAQDAVRRHAPGSQAHFAPGDPALCAADRPRAQDGIRHHPRARGGPGEQAHARGAQGNENSEGPRQYALLARRDDPQAGRGLEAGRMRPDSES